MENVQNMSTQYIVQWANGNAALKQNESVIELCNMLIYFVRFEKSVLMAYFKKVEH